jgi:hypothetical protein
MDEDEKLLFAFSIFAKIKFFIIMLRASKENLSLVNHFEEFFSRVRQNEDLFFSPVCSKSLLREFNICFSHFPHSRLAFNRQQPKFTSSFSEPSTFIPPYRLFLDII